MGCRIFVAVACLAMCPSPLLSGPVAFDTWYEFSFFDAGNAAMGCFPADPGAPECQPSTGTPTVFADAPPWTFVAPAAGAVLTVVDAFDHGDAFEVFDFGALIGVTVPAVGGDFITCGDDPVPCLADPLASKVFLPLGAGPHSLTFVPYASPYGGGAAYFRITPIPEPAAAAAVLFVLCLLCLTRRRVLLAVILVAGAALELSAQSLISARIVNPQPGAVLTGVVSIQAEHMHATLSPLQVGSVRFEISSGGGPWTSFGEFVAGESQGMNESPGTWSRRMDTGNYSPGSARLRVRVRYRNGLIGYSQPVDTLLNRPPVAVAQALPQSATSVSLNGTASSDPDGTITAWEWDFGDGTTGSGPVVVHSYVSPGTYFPILTVTDNYGAKGQAYLELVFADGPTAKPADKCICKSITLRGDNLPGEKDAFGPDGKAGGGDSWPKFAGRFDGKTLGPLHDDTENATDAGEKRATGYAFEVHCTVEGDPKHCKEIQVLRGTRTILGRYPNQKACEDAGGTWKAADSSCTIHHPWKGTSADLDKDGTADIDVSTEAKCKAAGGKWDGTKCTVRFPGPKYGPDTPEDTDAGGAYESEYDYKKYAGTNIIAFDAPSSSGMSNGSKLKYEFVFLVRGTDNKYCYVAFKLEAERKAGKDDEKLTETGTAVGAANVPGVP
jgi:hypothetical protein